MDESDTMMLRKLQTGYLVQPCRHAGASIKEEHAFATLADAFAFMQTRLEPSRGRVKETK